MLYDTNKIAAKKLSGACIGPVFLCPVNKGGGCVVWAARLDRSLSDTLKTPRFGAGGSCE